jgi:hypothetical protein
LVAQEAVFEAMMEAVDVTADSAFEVTLDTPNVGWGEVGGWRRILEKFEDGFGSEAFGVKAVGEHAADGAAPAPTRGMAGGVEFGLLEEEFPSGAFSVQHT